MPQYYRNSGRLSIIFVRNKHFRVRGLAGVLDGVIAAPPIVPVPPTSRTSPRSPSRATHPLGESSLVLTLRRPLVGKAPPALRPPRPPIRYTWRGSRRRPERVRVPPRPGHGARRGRALAEFVGEGVPALLAGLSCLQLSGCWKRGGARYRQPVVLLTPVGKPLSYGEP